MKINLFANYRLIANKTSFDIHIPAGSTVQDVIDQIIFHIPELKSSWMDEDGRVYHHLNILVNGVDILSSPHYLNMPVNDEDILDFLPPIAGGSM